MTLASLARRGAVPLGALLLLAAGVAAREPVQPRGPARVPSVDAAPYGALPHPATPAPSAVAAPKSHASCLTEPGNLVSNCSFETGDLSGWTAVDLSSPYYPLGVVPAGTWLPFASITPTEGNYALAHGFDGCGPGLIEVSQDVVLCGSDSTLAVDWQAWWDMTYGANEPRTFRVVVEQPPGGPALVDGIVLSAAPGTSNWTPTEQTTTLNFTSGVGPARVRFLWSIPECFTGPGQFMLDNVTLTCTATGCDLTPVIVRLDDGTRFTSDAELAAQTSALVGEIDANEARLVAVQAALADGSRWVDDAELNAVHADLSAAIAALRARLDEHDTRTTEMLEMQMRIEIEHALGEDVNANKPMATMFLPEALGGRLGEVGEVVDETIARIEAAGCNGNRAREAWLLGNEDAAAGRWDEAYVHYHAAYEAAVRGPCN